MKPSLAQRLQALGLPFPGGAAERRAATLAEHDQQVRDVGASLVTAAEKVGGPAVFLFCGVREDHGTTTIATAVSRAIAESGRRTVFATREPREDEAATPSRSLLEVVESGGAIAFDNSRWTRLVVPRQFLELPEAARDPRKWLKIFDLVILDSLPVTEVGTRYWVPRAHGVVLVVDGERAGIGTVLQARDAIVRLGGTLTGVVLNRYRSQIPRFIR